MKTTHYLFATLIAATLLLGCKKKDSKTEDTSTATTTTTTTTGSTTGGNPVVETIAKIKTESMAFNGTTSQIDYTYDSKGRVTKMVYSTGYYVTVEWFSDKCIYRNFNAADVEQSSTTYNLNAAGYSEYYSSAGSTTINEFDTDWYLKKTTSTNSSMGISTTYNISGGNVTGYTSNNGGTATYEHYLDKLNTIGSLNKGFSILGKQDKNLLKKVSVSIGSSSTSADYTYEFDSKNRVTKMIQVQGSYTSVTLYTYY